MISMVGFEFGTAKGLMAAKKDVTANGGFGELLARTAAQLSGDPSANENAPVKEAKNKEDTKSVSSDGGEKKGSDGEASGEDTAASAPAQALAATLLAVPLPPQVQEEFAQNLAVGKEDNSQRVGTVENPAPEFQAQITLQAPLTVRDGDTGEVSEALKAGEISSDFEKIVSVTKAVLSQAQNKTAELSPQEAAGAKAPLTFQAKEESIKATQTKGSAEISVAVGMRDTDTQTKTADITASAEEVKEPEPKTLPSTSQIKQTIGDTENAVQKTSVRSGEVQQAEHSPEKAEKPREKIQFTDTVEPANTKLTANAGVDHPVPETKTAEIRQPVFEQVAKVVTKTAKDMSEEGSCTFDMKLFPEGLGKLEVRMAFEGKNLTLMVTAHSEEAAKLLTGGAEKLRNTLSENYQVAHLEIRTEIRTDTQSSTTFFANGFGGSGHYGSAYAKEQTRYGENELDTGADVASERHIQVGMLDARV